MRNRVLSNITRSIFTANSNTDTGASIETRESPTHMDGFDNLITTFESATNATADGM